MSARRLRILTWHVHGNYLYYLSQAPHDFFIVTSSAPAATRPGLTGSLPWGDNLHEVREMEVRDRQFDLVLYQSRRDYEQDRLELLSAAQRQLPQIVLEHDPPQQHPTNTRHWLCDPGVLLVHVTAFNDLMWDSGAVPTRVIEHGVLVPPQAVYRGSRDEGIVVVNHLAQRGRRLGTDVFERARARVPLTLVGMGAAESGGLGEIGNAELPGFMAEYRFFFHPVRYTSLGLALIEAMHVGLPVVALATAGLPGVIVNGENGYADTDVERLIVVMQALLADAGLARLWGQAAQRTARERFGIERFVSDWNETFAFVAGLGPPLRPVRPVVLSGAPVAQSSDCMAMLRGMC